MGRTEQIRLSISDNALHSAGTSDSSDAACLIVSFMFGIGSSYGAEVKPGQSGRLRWTEDAGFQVLQAVAYM